MKIGLVDVDGHNFPNIALMKISSYHKSICDDVEWATPLFGEYDILYKSKVFSFSKDDDFHYNATKIIRGGSGYAIEIKDGRECYNKQNDKDLPQYIEHIYPDYSLYPKLTENHAYGYLTRGCPKGCEFCHVATKEGRKSYKVADLNEFWNGQKYITLCDPNILACKEWRDLLNQLIDSKSYIDLNQGIDVRLLTEEKAEMLSMVKLKDIHFAWDRYDEGDKVISGLKLFKKYYKKSISHNLIVFTIVNFDTTLEQDLDRIYRLRDLGFWAYIMIYDKEHCNLIYNKLQRWVNNRFIFAKCERFEDYLRK